MSLSTLGLELRRNRRSARPHRAAGWFRLGPTPGQLGSAVILGHVDNYTGPGVFFVLRTLAAGDQMDVTLADGVTARFSVDSVAMYPKGAFPPTASTIARIQCPAVGDLWRGLRPPDRPLPVQRRRLLVAGGGGPGVAGVGGSSTPHPSAGSG